MKNLLIFVLLGFITISCKKTEAVKPLPLPSLTDSSGFLEIHVANMVDNLPLLAGNTYTTSNADTFSVDKLLYYISNIQLHTSNGFTYTEPESYYLVDFTKPNSLHLMVKGVPRANYTSISFLIGVDHQRSVSGAQTGALDPANNMFWDWNTGYINVKLEGYSPQSTAFLNKIVYHIGGHIGKFNGLRSVDFPFNDTAFVNTSHTPVLNLKADIGKWFSGVNILPIANYNTVTSLTQENEDIANNIATMFSVTSIVN